MARRDNPDRFLQQRKGRFYYKRRVPGRVAKLDVRAPTIRLSLKTNDLAAARLKRDAFESADDLLWSGMLTGNETDSAMAAYKSAIQRAEAMGFAFRSASDIAAREPLPGIVQRVEAVTDANAPPATIMAALGGASRPAVHLTDALATFMDEIAASDLRGKSAQQRRKWRNIKKRCVARFVDVVGDLDITMITRDHALAFYRFWLARVAPIGTIPTHSASSANREISGLRVIYSAWFGHFGEPDRVNPFAGLVFGEGVRRTRPPLPTHIITDTIMRPGALDSLNAQARGVLLSMIETGARPSELCNLKSEHIILSASVPHIKVEPRTDVLDPREIKTGTSMRKIPLIGVALAVFEKFPDGFARYAEHEETASATINKYLRDHDLVPQGAYTLYSLRHAFEDRMKEAGIGDELRRILMGHALDRQRYGSGGSLEWQRDELAKIELPFDRAIV